ncbi:unnamed protein product [Parascedosporium putredinis]|uniref:Glucanase n=1 Tax=Parascedosporium putredinis TaxID=1442378 RepID=A0A9P1H5H1_9PEZI|nr:unnamed protein product [Parascedosporium putredinis]CAI7999346.1 unnamed protein product [Parascedosporium putredinis]
MKFAATLGLFASLVAAQQVGKEQSETHPKMSWSKCTGTGANCEKVNAEVVIDANWRWLHTTDGYDNCYDGNEWVTSVCSTGAECAEKCAVEGADYGTTYGASTSGDGLTLKFLTKHEYGTNIGSRFYLMNGADKYQMFELMDHEFTFDVDLSTLDCGLNGALYFVAMEEDGGLASYPGNKAGAKYGTGYCDAQCARDLKFIGGKGNVEGWDASSNDANAGVGAMGACCAEIDGVQRARLRTHPHPCKDNNYHICENDTCGGTYSEDRYNGLCDANGCDYNPYRMGNPDFYGIGKTVDTSKKFTVVTRFEENKMSQFFVQDGKKIEIPAPTFEGLPDSSAITPEFCDTAFEVFDDFNRFNDVGGWPLLNDALRIPMKEGTPGAARGPCAQDSGVPADVEANFADAAVVWSNIRHGPIGSTVDV